MIAGELASTVGRDPRRGVTGFGTNERDRVGAASIPAPARRPDGDVGLVGGWGVRIMVVLVCLCGVFVAAVSSSGPLSPVRS